MLAFPSDGEFKMTKPKFLSAALIAAAMFATPAMARTGHVTSRHHAEAANASASPAVRYIDGRAWIPASRVGVEPVPHYAKDCDVGDNPFVC
jgi:hypothetical protein